LPLAVMRDERLIAVHRFDEVFAGETVLVLFPRTALAETGDTFAAVADRFHAVSGLPGPIGEPVEPGRN
jgi:hypothetical protein